MASNGNGNEVHDFEFTNTHVPNGLSKINTKPATAEMCNDDTTPPVKVTNVEQLHALQRKKASAPTTPRTATNPSTPRSMTPRSLLSEEERQKQQMQSVRYKLWLKSKLSEKLRYSKLYCLFTSFRNLISYRARRACDKIRGT
jgi:phosphoenolpyruvate carboxykinase (ATP)